MKTHNGTCGLCQKKSVLIQSHLLPKAFYKLLRTNDERTDRNPVVITHNLATTTSNQVAKPLLCSNCEDLFSKNGEKYICNQCAKPDGQFSLRNKLNTLNTYLKDSQISSYDIHGLPDLKADKIIYFAASIFWRASATCWEISGKPIPQFSLGAIYQEQLRQFLLGQAAFPQKARLIVYISSENPAPLIVTSPNSNRIDGVRYHKFFVPGMLFKLFIGWDVAHKYDHIALNGKTKQLLWLSPLSNDPLFHGSISLLKKSPPTKNLINKLKLA